ncbi:hypothetical protein CW304_28845 [Bacillus sp. UFRGS-B20]|nr:hypothetical protein CW304_28845 [Bacillus sp. UFRGS-B20]
MSFLAASCISISFCFAFSAFDNSRVGYCTWRRENQAIRALVPNWMSFSWAHQFIFTLLKLAFKM